MQSTITTMAALPQQLAALVQRAGEAALDRAPDGEWTARTTLAHLRDEEAFVFRLRVERMLSEDEPVFAPYPPEAWLSGRRRNRDGTRELLRDFALQRKASINLLERITSEERERTGHHPERGAFTIGSWVAYWANHDREHLLQIERRLEGN